MVVKPVQLLRTAAGDIDAALSYCRREGGEPMANRFVDALEAELGRIGRHPLIGSLRYSYELGIPALRNWPLTGFPYIVCYVDRAGSVDVWRVLHARRDIPAWLAPPDDRV